MRIERDLVVQDEGINKLLKCRVIRRREDVGLWATIMRREEKGREGREGGA